MAGHSKWETTKRHKAVVDAKRGKIFSAISKEITIAAKAGGGDPEMNPRLRTVLLKAKGANMPNDNIERAIKKGTGELPGVSYEEIVYEGYGPGGVAVIIETTTDNKNRTASEIRSLLSKSGGNLAGSNSVAFQFERVGQFFIDSEKTTEEELMEATLEAGVEDIKVESDHFELICPVSAFYAVSQALESKGIVPDSAELAYVPVSTVPVTDPDVAKQVLNLVDALEDQEDVQNIHLNYDIEESLLEAVRA
ncbi:MAG TPA: YebC/PmpR family DNA-binding transcriptional regulator [Opitutales bacterium]|nr:YebC/PmpR family DNA-binding transcriptional regulator [Opitutales bacterium]